MVKGLPFVANHAGHFGALATVAAYRDGAAWLDDVIAVIDHNRALLAELLAEKLPEVAYTPPRAGYLTWLDLRALELGDDPSEALLERGRVAVNPGRPSARRAPASCGSTSAPPRRSSRRQ